MMNGNKTKIIICAGTSGVSGGAREVEKNLRAELNRRGAGKNIKIITAGDRGLFRDVLVDVVSSDGTRASYEFVKPEDAAEIVESHILKDVPVKRLLAGKSYENFFAKQTRIVLYNCGEIAPEDIDEYIERGGWKAYEKVLGGRPADVIDEMKKSGLRGRGGAGFPTGVKWEFCAKEKPGDKYIICNADEGDPGAFMDRSVLEGDPQAVLEGMAIAAYAVTANRGVVYCRAEYPLAVKRLKTAIARAREKGFLGPEGRTGFDVEIMQGAGAFVCGEETALIASIEGRRGTPSPRPPFPAQKGLHGFPTVINNVETLANVRHIINRGAGWFSSIGTGKSTGTKVFALAGKVKNTGLVEIPMGTSIRELIFGAGGGMKEKNIKLKAVQIGGPSGGCLPEELLDTGIDYESITQTGAIMGSGGLIVMDERSCMPDIARYFLGFTVAESCGKCAPCRIGLKRMLEVLEKICSGAGTEQHIGFLREMSTTIKNTSLCGLGQTAPNPVLTTLKYFEDEYKKHIEDKECPAHVCTELVKFEVMREKCIKCGKCFSVCPAGAVIWKKGEYAEIDKKKCIKCKACITACPVMAIE